MFLKCCSNNNRGNVNSEPGIAHVSGPMSNVSYDSHVVTRRRMADELPRVKTENNGPDSYNSQMMDVEIQRVSRELYKAFSGMNSGFAEVSSETCRKGDKV